MLRFVVRLALATLVVLSLFAPGPAYAQPNDTNRIHMTAKPAVVRIYAGYVGTFTSPKHGEQRIVLVGSGSGYIINPAGYILTNAHVVGDIKEGDEAAKKRMYQTLVLRLLNSNNLPVTDANIKKVADYLGRENYNLSGLQRINYVFLQSGKKYPFEIKAYGAPTGEGKDLESGKDVAVLKIEVRNAPTLRLGTSSTVNVGDHVWVMGFPGAADSDHLDAQSELEPTTNDGSISAKKATKDGTPVLQTSTNTTHGNSGGPVINAKGEAIGLLTFRGNTINGQEVQGFNFIVPIDTAQEFVRQAGTDNQPGTVDAKWKSGLEHYWKKEYSAAQKDFQEIVTLFPDHGEAKKLVTECQENIIKGEDIQVVPEAAADAGAAVAVLVVMGLAGLLVVIVIIVVIVMVTKKKAPARSMGQHGMAPVGMGGYGPPQQTAAQGGGYGPPGMHGGPPQGGMPHGASPHAPTAFQSPPAVRAPVGSKAARGGRTEVYSVSSSIRFVAGPLSGQSVPVIATGLVIGREPGLAQIVIQDSQVSSAHAWIGMKGDILLFADRGSTNGSMVNGRPVMVGQEVPLSKGDVITLGKSGSVKFVVE